MSTLAVHTPEVGSPARQVVELLARREHMTVAELVEATGVTTTAVRLQVNRLLAEGWIASTKRRGGPGRPADVLTLSKAGRHLFGQHAEDLCKLIIDELLKSEGAARTKRIMRGVSRRMAEQFRLNMGGGARHGAVGSGDVSERLARFAQLMSEKGVLVDAKTDETGQRLTVYTCPFPELVADHPVICEMERAAIGEMMDANVQLECCMAAGHARCEFHVGEG
jgi:predicted ArsR family transcriptional regulator